MNLVRSLIPYPIDSNQTENVCRQRPTYPAIRVERERRRYFGRTNVRYTDRNVACWRTPQ